jgi:hypothetical protein
LADARPDATAPSRLLFARRALLRRVVAWRRRRTNEVVDPSEEIANHPRVHPEDVAEDELLTGCGRPNDEPSLGVVDQVDYDLGRQKKSAGIVRQTPTGSRSAVDPPLRRADDGRIDGGCGAVGGDAGEAKEALDADCHRVMTTRVVPTSRAYRDRPPAISMVGLVKSHGPGDPGHMREACGPHFPLEPRGAGQHVT